MLRVTGGEKASRNSLETDSSLIIWAMVISSSLYNWELWLGKKNQYIEYFFQFDKRGFFLN